MHHIVTRSGGLIAAIDVSDMTRWSRGDGLEIVLLITGAILLGRLASWVGGALTTRISAEPDHVETDAVVRSEQTKHRHALTQVLTGAAVVVIYFVAGLLVLQRFGIPLNSIVAPATVAGIAVGVGAQKIVQDVFAGFFIIAEHQYGFGDVIRVSTPGTSTGVMGTVEEVSLRLTRMRTANGEVLILPNGEIRQVANLSRDWARVVIDVPVPLGEDTNHARDILRRVAEEAFGDASLRPLLLDAPSVLGLESHDVGSLTIRFVARTQPGKQFEVGRILRARITLAFEVEAIPTPPLAPPRSGSN